MLPGLSSDIQSNNRGRRAYRHERPAGDHARPVHVSSDRRRADGKWCIHRSCAHPAGWAGWYLNDSASCPVLPVKFAGPQGIAAGFPPLLLPSHLCRVWCRRSKGQRRRGSTGAATEHSRSYGQYASHGPHGCASDSRRVTRRIPLPLLLLRHHAIVRSVPRSPGPGRSARQTATAVATLRPASTVTVSRR